jgi:very-short-patch-repair endonuclease
MSWADVASSQAGAITRRQLIGCGMGSTTVSRLVRSGALIRHAPGVFVVRGAPVTYRTGVWIAVLATGGVVGFATAAHLWGFVAEPPELVQLVLSNGRHVVCPYGARIYRVFVPASAITTYASLPLTTRVWSLLDHLGTLSVPEGLRLVDRAIQRRWIERRDLSRRLEDCPGRRGNRVIRALVAATADGAAAQSERVLHRLLRRAGIRSWKANHGVFVAGRLVAVIDIAILRRRLAIEVDGYAYHSDVDRFERDRHRQNALVSLGWTVLRFTWRDLTERPQYVVHAIERHLR